MFGGSITADWRHIGFLFGTPHNKQLRQRRMRIGTRPNREQRADDA
jgi:hypothetical protein